LYQLFYVIHHIREDKILYESLGSLIEDVVYHLIFINERFHKEFFVFIFFFMRRIILPIIAIIFFFFYLMCFLELPFFLQ